MAQLELNVVEVQVDGEVGYHFHLKQRDGQTTVIVYRSDEHAGELNLSPAGYPNPHLARAMANAIRSQLNRGAPSA